MMCSVQTASIPKTSEVYFQLALMAFSLFAANRFLCSFKLYSPNKSNYSNIVIWNMQRSMTESKSNIYAHIYMHLLYKRLENLWQYVFHTS